MKRTLKLTVTILAVSFLLNFVCCAAPGSLAYANYEDYAELFTKGVYGETNLPYRLYIPADRDPEQAYPIILSLHGAGDRGNDNLMQLCDGIFPYMFSDPSLYENVILLTPQCPEDGQWVDQPWSVGVYSVDTTPESAYLRDAIALLGEVAEQYNGDRSRLYITGFSMGGYGTWDALARHPGVFAAAIPICGGADSSRADLFAATPIRTYHCTGDQVVPFAGTAATAAAVKAAGGDIVFTEIDSTAHDAWTTAYSDAELYGWLLSQTLTASEESETPDAAADSTAAVDQVGSPSDVSEKENVSVAAPESVAAASSESTSAPETTVAEDDKGEGAMAAGPTVAIVVFVIATIVLGCVIYLRRDEFN